MQRQYCRLVSPSSPSVPPQRPSAVIPQIRHTRMNSHLQDAADTSEAGARPRTPSKKHNPADLNLMTPPYEPRGGGAEERRNGNNNGNNDNCKASGWRQLKSKKEKKNWRLFFLLFSFLPNDGFLKGNTDRTETLHTKAAH